MQRWKKWARGVGGGGRGESSRLSLFSTHHRPLPQITRVLFPLDFFSRPPYHLRSWHRLILAKKEECSDISGLNQAINSICCMTYKFLPFCNNQSVLHLGSFKPNMILGLSKGLLKESKQPRLTLTNLTTGAKITYTTSGKKKRQRKTLLDNTECATTIQLSYWVYFPWDKK